MTIELVESTGPIRPAPDHRHLRVCTCVRRHIDEAVAVFDASELLLEEAKGLSEESDACAILGLLKEAALLRLSGIREVRAAHFGLHFDPSGTSAAAISG